MGKALKFMSIALTFFMVSSCEDVSNDVPPAAVATLTFNIIADQKDVEINKKYEVTFSSKIETSTLTLSSFFVVNDLDMRPSSESVDSLCAPNQALPGTIACETNGLKCTLTLKELLESETSYILCLLDQISFKDTTLAPFEGLSKKFKTGKLLNKPTEDSLSATGGSPVDPKNAPFDDPNGNRLGTIPVNISGIKSGDILEIGFVGEPESTTIVTSEGGISIKFSSAPGSTYALEIISQPEMRFCSIANGSGTYTGTINPKDLIEVNCGPKPYAVGGSVSGLSGGILILEKEGLIPISIGGNGAFTVGSEYLLNSPYLVTIMTQPTGQICAISNGTGVAGTGSDAVISIVCSTFKYLFLSQNTHDGFFSNGQVNGISGADAHCNNVMNQTIGLPTGKTYKALMVDGVNRIACTSSNCTGGGVSEHANWVLLPNVSYYKPGGTPETDIHIFTTNSVGIIATPIALNSSLDPASSSVWTGLNIDWTTHVDLCNGWNTAAIVNSGRVGDTNSASSTFISNNSKSCDNSYKIYCVEQ
jgi:hypothetical protein